MSGALNLKYIDQCGGFKHHLVLHREPVKWFKDQRWHLIPRDNSNLATKICRRQWLDWQGKNCSQIRHPGSSKHYQKWNLYQEYVWGGLKRTSHAKLICQCAINSVLSTLSLSHFEYIQLWTSLRQIRRSSNLPMAVLGVMHVYIRVSSA